MTTALSVKNLCLSIHDKPILNDISLAVDAGQIIGLIGESGSGKSLTAYSIIQLLPAGSQVSGEILLAGNNLLAYSEDQMCAVRGSDIGFIFQEPMTALNPVKTIGEQVAETVMIHQNKRRKEAYAIAAETLTRVDLPTDKFPLSRYPHELSGGQRQRVVIAMAIALRPKLLIADEPTTALDVTTQAQILTVLKRLVEEDDMALVLISHDLAVVANIANTLVILKEGNIVDEGPSQTVFRELRHPYTRKLMEASSHTPQRTAHNTTESPLLVVEDLIRDYRTRRPNIWSKPGTFRAINKVSFSIARGESVGLVGESGCGKSTLTRAILGLDAIQGGRIQIDGDNIVAHTTMSRPLRRKMQVVFQDPYGSFNPRHRVRRLIAEPFHLVDEAPQGLKRLDAVYEALESVGMHATDADKFIHEFSGGQRQRIAIARALIIKPALIVLDEAVSALDVSIRAQILDLLADLADRYSLAYLFISHDLSVVRRITDRVLVMQHGVVVEQGDTDSVFNSPQHDYTKTLIAAAPTLETAL